MPASADYTIAWDGTDGLYFNPANPATGPWNLALTASDQVWSSEYGNPHFYTNINDGLYGNRESWLASGSDPEPAPYIGVEFGSPIQFGKIAWGRDNGNATGESGSGGGAPAGQYVDRWEGTYTVQYTQAVNPSTLSLEGSDPSTSWANIGTVTLDATAQTGFTGYLRHGFDVSYQGDTISATGVRLKASPNGNAIDELELYGPPAPGVPSTGLAAWYNAENGVTTDGSGNVTAWQDLTGNGNDAVAGSNAPELVAGSLEGKPVIHFEGGSMESLVLPTSSQLGIQNSDYEIFFVGRAASDDVQFYLASNAYASYEMHIRDNPTGRFIPFGTGSESRYADLPQSLPVTADMPYLYSTRVEDGTGIISVVGIDSSDTVANARSSADANLVLGMRAGGTDKYPLTGDIAEVLVYNQKLTVSQRQQVEQYLMQKWNAALVLSETGRSYQESMSPEIGFNLALLDGSEAFAKDVISNGANWKHQTDHLNDGDYGNSASWIGATRDSFAGISFTDPHEITAIAFGRDNLGSYDDRAAGTYSLQYTLVPDPDEFTADEDWITIGSITQTSAYPDDDLGLRHLYRFDPVVATGIRLLVSSAAGVQEIAIDELEVFGVPEPSAALLCLVGLLFVVPRRFRRSAARN